MSKKVQEQHQRPRIEEIEPRILYSSDFAPGLAPDTGFAPETEQRSLEPGGEFTPAAAQDAQVRRQEIAFVDRATPDYDALIEDIRTNAGAERDIEVVLLDASQDGIGQISAALAGRQDISAVHLIAHGSDGEVQMGSAALNFESLLKNAAQIKGWGQALTDDADLLIYGCDVAASDAGRSLVDALARLTGADVAASDDRTGHSDSAGDWDLEYREGSIETQLALSSQAQASWQGSLQAAAVGAETRANSTTTDNQFLEPGSSKQVAVAQDGTFVVTWVSQDQDTSGTGVYARRFAADGTALSGEVLVNQTTAGDQRFPAVATDANGNFVVMWQSENQVSPTSGWDTYARRFDASGAALGNEFLVNTTTAGDQDQGAIAMASDGRFVIGWTDRGGTDGSGTGVYARVYDAAGVAQTGELQVDANELAIASVLEGSHAVQDGERA